MHIYVFGSLCRGDISAGSDVDLLALADNPDPRFDPDTFSIYSYQRLEQLWGEGNPFAWHLALESRMIFSSDERDHIKSLGMPASYQNCVRDCKKFYALFRDATTSVMSDDRSGVFDLSTIFLSVRNIATCYSLGVGEHPDFSRSSALHLGETSIPITGASYHILERARILCTRGFGKGITPSEIGLVIEELPSVDEWMARLVEKAKTNGRIQQ